jgi:uncharacterized repeat protein (TIGR03803 family)
MNCNRFRVHRWLPVVVVLMAISASAEWKEKVLYSFQGGTDGATPAGGVVFDSQGNLYGATSGGGSGSCAGFFQCGTVYQLSPPAQKGGPWTETVLHNFQGNKSGDGTSPGGGLVIDNAGNLYGTTGYGGTGGCVLLGSKEGCGTVYELSPPKVKGGAWTERVLYSFKGGKDGYVPDGDLVFDSAGNLYGATIFGGGKGTTCNSLYQYCGTVFELSPPQQKGGKWTEKVLHSFAGIAAGKKSGDGANPNGGLVLDSKGAAYGTTYYGGYDCPHSSNQGCGTAFKLSPPVAKGDTWGEEVLDRFNPVNSGAAGPVAGLIFDSHSTLYGTTLGGGNSGSGTIFQLAPRSDGKWVERVLYRFRDGNDGGSPRARVVLDSEGNLYGTASGGGSVGGGTLFQFRYMPQGTWTFGVLYTFTGSSDGSYPASKLIFDETGKLYGTARESGNTGQGCGRIGCGTVFEVQP